jgi:choline dehydrogenase
MRLQTITTPGYSSSMPKLAVLDAGFHVRGAGGLWVVDASVFPRIPVLYSTCIQSSISMISGKAADVVIARPGA